MTEDADQLWIMLLKIEAATAGVDISGVPECVLDHYAQQDFTVREALKELISQNP